MIEIKGLRKRFKDGSGICYKDITFESGKSYLLLGASGCGKSTLLNMLAGILSPTCGSIVIDGKEINALSQRERDAFRIRNVGYVFQDFKLLERMSVADNINVLKLEHVDTGNMDGLLESLGILKLRRRRVDRLSGGERQRVAVARALIKNAPILLADEPTGNLNYAIGRGVMEALTALSKGRTLICVTHDERLSDLFDEVLDMNGIASALPEGGAEDA